MEKEANQLYRRPQMTGQAERRKLLPYVIHSHNLINQGTHTQQPKLLRGFARNFFTKNPGIYYGGGWVGPGLTRIFFGKSSQNSS